MHDFISRAASTATNSSGEVLGRMFYVVRQFCISKFLSKCYPDAPEDANAQNVCKLIMHQLVKREKADADDTVLTTPPTRATLKRKPSTGSSRSNKQKGARGANK